LSRCGRARQQAAAAVAEVSQTVNGALRVKLHDKHAALVSIGRYLGMFDDKAKVEVVYGISEEPMSAEEATFFCVIRHKEISWYINFKQHQRI
jgi:hypothetical protein